MIPNNAGSRSNPKKSAEFRDRGSELDRHLTQSHVSIDAHTRQKQIELASSIAHKIKIYLDINFWIELRKANSGDGTGDAKDLLNDLRRAVAAGTAICPLSDVIFLELLKQADSSSRQSTAALMDELSLGVTLIESDMRMKTEIAHFIHGKCVRERLHSLNDLAWCKVGHVFGFKHPVAKGVEGNVMLALQKGVFDEMWDLTLGQMIARAGFLAAPEMLNFDAIAVKLNSGKRDHASEIKSFEQTYKNEVRGIVDLTAQVARDVVREIGVAEGAIPIDEAMTSDTAGLIRYKNLLAIVLQKNMSRHELRSLHVQAWLHASHRWNKGRKFEGNDLQDFAHATAALGYFDAFFTEKSLRTMLDLKHKQTSLASLYNCAVCATLTEAKLFVERIVDLT